MLDRVGDEVARATSVVRYAPGSRFSSHTHDKGEEFLVLSGVFSDEHGDYPAGSYVRNPWGTQHAPSSAPGCTIFVKLRQMVAEDQTQLAVDTGQGRWLETASKIEAQILFDGYGERVRLERWSKGARRSIRGAGLIELLVLEGRLQEQGQADHPALSWLRLPAGLESNLSTETGCTVWIKERERTGQPTSGLKTDR